MHFFIGKWENIWYDYSSYDVGVRLSKCNYIIKGEGFMNRVEEIINNMKVAEILNKKQDKKVPAVVVILAVVGIIALVAGIAYAVYRFFAPNYLEDFEDEFEDEFDDEDFFEDFNEDEEDVVVEDVFEEE